ncbi:MAG: flagellar protein FlgN [Azonexus sp.]|jgi:flagellar biosynthesis/type III secretory pathway chaperone|nr:flagellar protein FlgN [Azonexus sp.]
MMDDLAAITRREIALINHFIDLLKEEQEALRQANPEPLPRLAAAKVEQVEQLNALEAERRATLGISSEDKVRSAMENWLSANPAEQQLARDWQTLLDLAREAKELHRLNAGLITLHLQQTADALHILDSRRAADALYGNDGQATGPSGSRLVDSA